MSSQTTVHFVDHGSLQSGLETLCKGGKNGDRLTIMRGSVTCIACREKFKEAREELVRRLTAHLEERTVEGEAP